MDDPRPSAVPVVRSSPVPTRPPARLPGASASELGRRHLLGFGAATAAYLVVFALLDAPWVLIGAGLAWFVLGWVLLGRVGDRLVEELEHGYTTLVIDTGLFWFRATGWTAWDFAGVWRFTRGGVRPPDPGVTDPPGLYPSPRRSGRREVWTGCAWTRVHR